MTLASIFGIFIGCLFTALFISFVAAEKDKASLEAEVRELNIILERQHKILTESNVSCRVLYEKTKELRKQLKAYERKRK